MGFHAKWTSTCDHCGERSIVELTPEQDDGSYFDLWGPAFPDGWYQSNYDNKCQAYCTMSCLKAWLRAHGRSDEAEKLGHAVWVA